MSKSKGNVINPDEHVQRVGSDVVKMYLAFIGPYNEVGQYPWDLGGIAGIRRFLERVYTLQEKVHTQEDKELDLLMHQTIKKVGNDIKEFKFNTAISQMMICVNALEKKEHVSDAAYNVLLQLLAPFAPHLTEELWETQGHTDSIHTTNWPKYDENILASATITIAVQVNGKTRGTFTTEPDASEEDIKKSARQVDTVVAHIEGKEVVREILVPGRLVNLVVKEEA